MALAKSISDRLVKYTYKDQWYHSNCIRCGKPVINAGEPVDKGITSASFKCDICETAMIMCFKHGPTHGHLMTIDFLEFRDKSDTDKCCKLLQSKNIAHTPKTSSFYPDRTNIYIGSCLYPKDSGYTTVAFGCDSCKSAFESIHWNLDDYVSKY